MNRLRQIHFGTVLGVLAAIYIAVYLVQTVRHNYQLQQQISQLQTQISDLETDKQTLQYQIQYYQTDAYKEKEARAKLGLQAPGEGVVILPHKDAVTNVQQDKKSAPQEVALAAVGGFFKREVDDVIIPGGCGWI